MITATTLTPGMDKVIADALSKLNKKEYKLKFRREATCLYCFQLHEWIWPENFTVDEYYYFEDILNPDADRILYAISLLGGLKGFLVDSCDVYTDNISPEMVHKLKWDKIRNRKVDLANAGIMKSTQLSNEALAF